MEALPSVAWVSVSLPAVASISALILSIQRGLYHKRQQQEEGGISLSTDERLPLQTDYKRDLSVPFDDTNRITRITYCSLLLATLSALNLYVNVTHFKNDPENIHLIASSTGIFISWLYASVLAVTSRHYRLPNAWGWVLNVHLCIFYTIAFCFSVYQFCMDAIIKSPQMGWLDCLPLLLPVLLGFDLVYVTATMKQGPPFLDEKDRPVCNINVDSIFGKLSFNWVTNVVRIVSKKKGEMTDQDLPVLTPEFRAHNIFYIFGASRGTGSLFYRLCKANAPDIAIQVSLAITASFLYYAPAFFMNRLLQLLQDVSNGVYYEDVMIYGTLIVIGMGVSIVILGAITGQLWYHGK